jgi:hypothetical protein
MLFEGIENGLDKTSIGFNFEMRCQYGLTHQVLLMIEIVPPTLEAMGKS